jgi:hypothetical protein
VILSNSTKFIFYDLTQSWRPSYVILVMSALSYGWLIQNFPIVKQKFLNTPHPTSPPCALRYIHMWNDKFLNLSINLQKIAKKFPTMCQWSIFFS